MFNVPHKGMYDRSERWSRDHRTSSEKLTTCNSPFLYEQRYHPSLVSHNEAMIPYTNQEGTAAIQRETMFMNGSLLDSLREGGYLLYVRHGEATVGSDQPNLTFEDCSTQRNLSGKGRRQAVTYGVSLRRLGIPIEYPVITSPFCRNRETAAFAFSADNVQVDPFWVDIYKLSFHLSAWEHKRILNAFQTILETPPSQGRNKVIIAHSFPEGVAFGPIPNMGTVVVKPYGEGNGFEVVDFVSLEEFANFVE